MAYIISEDYIVCGSCTEEEEFLSPYYCTKCMALDEFDCCCSEDDED